MLCDTLGTRRSGNILETLVLCKGERIVLLSAEFAETSSDTEAEVK